MKFPARLLIGLVVGSLLRRIGGLWTTTKLWTASVGALLLVIHLALLQWGSLWLGFNSFSNYVWHLTVPGVACLSAEL